MKIYRIPTDDKFRPERQGFVWPPTNQFPGMDFGVEQDFDEWILLTDYLTDDPAKADFSYAPVFWNRYFFENLDENGDWGGGLDILGEEVDRILAYGMPTFTIAEADIRVINPNIDFGDLIIFCASRRGDIGIDIPLLCGPHPIPEVLPEKKYLASFMGNLETDGIRMAMRDELKDRTDCRIEHAGVPENEFAQIMLESYIGLAPRGQGAQSYRMYETMQLGVVPLYISDIDCRPFKNIIDWNKCSFWLKDTKNLSTYLDGLWISYGDDLRIKGQNARYMYEHYLGYQKWPQFVIKTLEGL